MTDKDYRPIPFWSWNDKLEEKELIEQIRWMNDVGFGGFFMHARGGLSIEYLSEEWFHCIRACCEEAKELGMSAWAYDENGWPSGFVGGKLLEQESNRDRYLTYFIGDYDENALVSYDISGENLIRVRKPEEVLGKCLNVYEHISVSTADILNKEVVDQFIIETHERYKCELGEEFSKLTAGFFTDEPQYQRWQHPYTRVLPVYYREKYGEDLLDGLGHMFVEKNGYRAFRYKYWMCMQELMLSAFAKNIYEWCDNNGVRLTGHYYEESSLAGQMRGCAGIMPFYEYEHIPGIDKLRKSLSSPVAAKQVSSVARQLGKKRVITETFAGCGWNSTPAELKRIAELQYVCGVNLLCHHLLPYSETGQRKRDYPMHFSPVTPWVRKDIKTFNEYFTKLGCLLGESDEIVRVAVFCPIRSKYFYYKHDDYTAETELEESYENTISMLSKMNVPYHIIDETILEKHGTSQNGILQVGQCAYDTIVFPKTETISRKNHELFKVFYRCGGKMLFMNGVPNYLEGEPYKYSFENNTTIEDIRATQDYMINKTDTEILSTLHKDAKGNRFIYVVNVSEKENYTVTFKGDFQSFKGYDIERDSFYQQPSTMTFRPGQSKILYYSQEIVPEEKMLEEILLPTSMEMVETSDNYMTLDRICVSYDGLKFSEECSFTKVFNDLLEMRYEGDLWLKYSFFVKTIPEKISFLTEDMNNLSCTINGVEMKFDGISDFEKRIGKADITPWCKVGKNEVVIKIHFWESENVYYALFGEGVTESLRNCLVYNTTIEACYLQGDFAVYSEDEYVVDMEKGIYFNDGNFYIDKRTEIVTDTVKDGYPFFAGCMTFNVQFKSDGLPCRLKLPQNSHLAYVKVNGISVEKKYFEDAPDISNYVKKGDNVAQITVYSGNRNLLGPHHYGPDPEPDLAAPQMFDFVLRYKDGECDRESKQYSFVKFL
ncbi:MAG: hypothetical protein IJZ53_02315 [Tyzzerella sp.]|nr:hypothetical protein [Tyzzerella sp.]